MRRLVAAIAASALGVVASAQSSAPPQNPAPSSQTAPPQFRSRIDLVHLDVSVLDANRRPVRGLTQADFRIVESGRPQEISAFAAVDVPAPPVATAPWIRDVGFDVRSNEDIRERRLFVLAIDDATIQNNPFAMKSVKEIARSVINRLGPNDLASVVFTRDNTHSQDFTSDRSRLLAAADSFTGGFRDMGKGLKDITAGPSADDLWYM